MSRILLAALLLCAACSNIYAQNKDIDTKAISIPEANCTSVEALANYIKQNFTVDSARVRAVYVWITNHISYDVARLKAKEKNPDMPPQTVTEVLSSRSAVCQGYSELFVALCRAMNINATLISGYTKFQGKVNPVSHAWVAVEIDSEWFLFDPTWGAGYVKDDWFYQAFNNSFYKIPPSKLIADHMPFDPMYQFLDHPLTNKEFIDGKPAATQALFQYKDTIKKHFQLASLQQMAAELRRMEAAGIQIDLLQERRTYLKNNLQGNASKDAFEEGGKAYMAAMDLYKQYIGNKNQQFSAISDGDLKKMMDSIEQSIKLSRSLLLEAVPKTDQQRQAKSNNVTNIDRFWIQLNKEKQFVQTYLSTDQAARKQLFFKR